VSKIKQDIDKEVRESSKHRCGYCLTPQSLTAYKLEIEHIYPISKGGTSEKENLWLACPFCNTYKSSQTHGTDPKTKEKCRFSIRERKSGKIILNSTRIK